LLLGDGHLEKNGRYARLRIDQNLKHSDYVNWLHSELADLASSKPRVVNEKDKRTNKTYSRLHFSTYSNEQILKWWQIFYENRRKIVPSNMEDMLKSPVSLAIWLMDDGYKRNDCAAIRMNTDSFNYDEQLMLIRCLWKNFKIKSHLHKKGKWFNIYLPTEEAKKFCQQVNHYILPSFKHKLL